jgi:hypothetical protein
MHSDDAGQFDVFDHSLLCEFVKRLDCIPILRI